MEEVQLVEKSATVYQKWALRFFVYQIITQIGVAIFVIITPVSFWDLNALNDRIMTFQIIGVLCILACVIMLVISFNKREKSTYKRQVALYGTAIIIVLDVALNLMAENPIA